MTEDIFMLVLLKMVRHYFYNKMLFFSDHCSCRIAGGEKGISMEDFKHDEDDIEECFC